MALLDGLLTPLGLAALLAAIPLILLYLIRPDPVRRRLPTLRFLGDERRKDASNPLLERLQRNFLLLIQLLAILVFAVSLATPYTNVPEQTTVEETVLVIDGSASMATQSDGGTRFERAVAAARDTTTSTTSVVYTGGGTRVLLRQGPPEEARAALSDLGPTDAQGDLQQAVETAAAIAGENAQIVVFSDFAGEQSWTDAVQRARARGLRVELRQFAGGGDANVGIVGRSFSGNEVTVTVKNFGGGGATRTLRLANQSASLELAPGDVTTATFTVPAGGGRVQLSPGDSFPTDDVAYIAAPKDAKIDVLLLTNDENRYLSTALSVVDEVSLTVKSPPTNVDATYDVIVYSNVEPDRLLRGNVEAGQDILADGGGVAVQAQSNMPDYGDLTLLDASGVQTNPTVSQVKSDTLTEGITFSPPEEYVAGKLQAGSPLVTLGDGTPLIATATRGEGRVLYYGYIEESSSFKYNYQYPVFWKRAVFYLAGRDPLPSLNRDTGDELTFDGETTVQTPSGTVTASRVLVDEAGFYAVGDRRIGASLYSAAESNVSAPNLDSTGEVGGMTTREEERQVPKSLTKWVSLFAIAVLLLELAYLRRRGDL